MSSGELKLSHLEVLYQNITKTLKSLEESHRSSAEAALAASEAMAESAGSDEVYNDSENAWMYILFVLMFYAFSIVVLMVKYIR